jgi:DNA polymerase-3 subunit beta
MKFTIERKPLLDAITKAASVIAPRNTVPILGNVHISAEAGEITMTGTDLDIEVSATVPATVEAPGAITVPAAMLADIARKLPDGALVSVALSDYQATIKAGRSRFVLPTLPAEDYPAMASAEYAVTIDTTAAAFCRILDKAKFAMSAEEARYYLQGVYLHTHGGTLRGCATDGHRLAQIDSDIAGDIPGVIVPRKAVLEIVKMFTAGDVAVSISEGKVKVAGASMTLVTKTVDGSFPDYTRVIPKDLLHKLRVDADEMRAALGRVSSVSEERTSGVKLTVGDSAVTISARSASAQAEDEIGADWDGPDLEIGFNGKYLSEVAGQIDGDMVLRLTSAGDPAIVLDSADDAVLMVVMPMRVS